MIPRASPLGRGGQCGSGGRGNGAGGLHTSWAPANQGISDSLMHQEKRAEGLPQEKGPEAAGPNKSGDTAERAQTQESSSRELTSPVGPEL